MNALEALTDSERNALERGVHTASLVAAMAYLLTDNPDEPGLADDARTMALTLPVGALPSNKGVPLAVHFGDLALHVRSLTERGVWKEVQRVADYFAWAGQAVLDGTAWPLANYNWHELDNDERRQLLERALATYCSTNTTANGREASS
jgi:hypothetical protein